VVLFQHSYSGPQELRACKNVVLTPTLFLQLCWTNMALVGPALIQVPVILHVCFSPAAYLMLSLFIHHSSQCWIVSWCRCFFKKLHY